MIVTMLFVLLISVILHSACSQTIENGCIKVPLIKNFNFSKLEGPWYGQEIGDDDEGAKKCLHYDIPAHQKNTSVVTINRIHSKGDKTVEPYKLTLMGNTSEYKIEWKGQTRKSWTIAVDYDSWGTWYVCVPEDNDKGVLFIATRDRKPSKATMVKAHDSVRKLGFKLTKPYLKSVDQSDCEN